MGVVAADQAAVASSGGARNLVAPVATLGRVGGLLGAALSTGLVLSLFWERHWRDWVFA